MGVYVWEGIEGKNVSCLPLQVMESARKLRMSIPMFILLPVTYDFLGISFVTRPSVPINTKFRGLFFSFSLSFCIRGDTQLSGVRSVCQVFRGAGGTLLSEHDCH